MDRVARGAVIGLDPSLRGFGWAVLEANGAYLKCGVEVAPDGVRDLEAWLGVADRIVGAVAALDLDAVELVGEKPQVYRGSKADPDDLLQLTGALAATAARIEALHGGVLRTWTPTPRQWKGQRSKETTEVAARKALGVFAARVDRDLEAVPEHLRNNAWDAVALALKHKGLMR